MEEYRKKVEMRLRIYTVICCCSVAMYMALRFFTKSADFFAQQLTMGVFVGMLVVAVFNLMKYFTALHNEKRLKEMYIRETDERNIAIQKETSQKGSAITLFCSGLGAIVAGFFDEKVCITIVAVTLFGALVTLALNAYYNKKM